MGETIRLTARDGNAFNAYVARPAGKPPRGLVVIQEIFGVNRHIRSVADGFAADGYLAAAPAIFDRVQPGVELDYDADGVSAGRDLAEAVVGTPALNDIEATIEWLTRDTGNPPGVIGYCFGGALAWLSATRLKPACAVCYYGRLIPDYRHEVPKCPVMMHFGEHDPSIPLAGVGSIRASHPDIPIHVYDAGHGFNCDQRSGFNPEAAALARRRTLDFFDANMKG
jgi:carboxymethylenebutenolidase